MHERQNFHYYISIFPKILWRFYFMIGVWIIFYHGLDGDLQEVFFYSFASCVVVRLPGEDQTVWVIECVGRDQTLLQCSFVSADRLQHTAPPVPACSIQNMFAVPGICPCSTNRRLSVILESKTDSSTCEILSICHFNPIQIYKYIFN